MQNTETVSIYNETPLYEEWAVLYKQAQDNMRKCRRSESIVLIEVAAQHPLIDGVKPNEEYEKRLLLGIELYNKFATTGCKVFFYTPGSLHMKDGVADKVSLSTAGKNFLMCNGIPANIIFADDANAAYKGDSGVYNSSDECYVSTRVFEELKATELHCVCSSAQAMRKALSYIRFGYVPYIHTVSCDVMYHSYVDEVFKYIPILLRDKSALQETSAVTEKIRASRKPE